MARLFELVGFSALFCIDIHGHTRLSQNDPDDQRPFQLVLAVLLTQFKKVKV
jgi:hypothetical protein